MCARLPEITSNRKRTCCSKTLTVSFVQGIHHHSVCCTSALHDSLASVVSILFRAHDAMGHQGISKVVARIQERHTWPGIRRTVGDYVSQCLICQQVRDKPGDVHFHLKNIQKGFFNELFQYDPMKLCPTDDGNTGILVIIDHFSNGMYHVAKMSMMQSPLLNCCSKNDLPDTAHLLECNMTTFPI